MYTPIEHKRIVRTLILIIVVSLVVTPAVFGSGEQETFAAVADEVLPVVVEVNVLQTVETQPSSFFEYFFGQPDQGQERQRPGLGSGVIVRKNGDTVYVVTNYHVVRQADQINIVLNDGREFETGLVGGDQRTDIALLEFSTSEDIPVAKLGDSDVLDVGHWVLAVGNPYGFESTVTAGIVSALGRTAQPGTPLGSFTEYIQTDASINPGSSGGALVNLDGELIGINTWIASQSGGSTGVGFAITANNVASVVNDLIEEGRVIYGWLGVSYLDPSNQAPGSLKEGLDVADKTGVIIDNVQQNSPAATDGLLPGDFVTAINGTPIDTGVDFARRVGGKKPGTTVEFTFLRYGEEMSREVTLDERPSDEALNEPSRWWPGMDIIPITRDIRNRLNMPSSIDGVMTLRVRQGSPVAAGGIMQGDIITAVNDTPTPNPIAFYRALNEAGNRVTFDVNRRGRQMGIRVAR